MAKIYDICENFKDEMKNISRFFNLDYKEKKFSNEEIIFDLVEKQSLEYKKLSDEKNKNDKKNILSDCVISLKKKNITKNSNLNEKIIEKQNIDNEFDLKDFIENFQQQNKEIKNQNLIIENKVIETKEKLKCEVCVENKKNFEQNILENCNSIKNKIDNFESTKKEKSFEIDKKISIIDNFLSFEKKYLQNGKYLIEGINLNTSVFVKKNYKSLVAKKFVDKVDKNICEKNINANNKNFKIDCKVDQNLLNGCYWPTQLS